MHRRIANAVAALGIGIGFGSGAQLVARNHAQAGGPELQQPGIELGSPRLRVQVEGAGVSGASLRGLAVGPDGSVWAAGSGGSLLRRDPVRRVWETVESEAPPETDFRDVEVLGSERVLLMAVQSPASILEVSFPRGPAGGAAELESLLAEERSEAFFDSIQFENPERGLVFGDPLDGDLFVARTLDGGRSWERLRSPRLPEPGEGEAGFAASGACIAVPGDGRVRIATGGATSRVLISDDFGETWSAVDHPIAGSGPTSGAYAIAFSDAEHGVLVGGDYTAPDQNALVAAWTSDGGKTWSLPESASPAGYRSGVCPFGALGSLAFVATGPNGMDLSLDGGRSWRPIEGAPGAHTLACAPDGSRVWFAGADGLLGSLSLVDADLEDLCQTLVRELELPTLAVAVLEQGRSDQVVVVDGESTSPGRRSELAEFRYRAASITKVFTGTLLALMAEAGKVGLDDPIGPYLPADLDFSEEVRGITFRELSSHASGLPRLPPVGADGVPMGMSGAPDDPYGQPSVDSLFAALAASGRERPDPGRSSGYSNLGVAVLGQLLAKIDERSFAESVQHWILGPLGLGSSAVDDPTLDEPRFTAPHSGSSGARLESLWRLGAYGPTGGLVCTVEDLARFAEAHLRAARGEPGLLPASALVWTQELCSTTAPRRSVGLGWQRIDLGSERTRLWHNGALGGYTSLMLVDPDPGRVVVLLTNRGFEPGRSRLEEAMRQILPFLEARNGTGSGR